MYFLLYHLWYFIVNVWTWSLENSNFSALIHVLSSIYVIAMPMITFLWLKLCFSRFFIALLWVNTPLVTNNVLQFLCSGKRCPLPLLQSVKSGFRSSTCPLLFPFFVTISSFFIVEATFSSKLVGQSFQNVYSPKCLDLVFISVG